MTNKFCFHLDFTKKTPKPNKGKDGAKQKTTFQYSIICKFYAITSKVACWYNNNKKKSCYVSGNTVANKAHLFVEL